MNRREFMQGAVAAAALARVPWPAAPEIITGVDMAAGPDVSALVLWSVQSSEILAIQVLHAQWRRQIFESVFIPAEMLTS